MVQDYSREGELRFYQLLTLAPLSEAQDLDNIDIDMTTKRYMHQYNFPGYSTGEPKPPRQPRRRKIVRHSLKSAISLAIWRRGIPICKPEWYRRFYLRSRIHLRYGINLRLLPCSDGCRCSNQACIRNSDGSNRESPKRMEAVDMQFYLISGHGRLPQRTWTSR